MSKIFREGMEIPQDPDGGSAKPKKKTKRPPKLKLPPVRKGEIEAPSDPDDGSIGMKKGGAAKGMHRMPDGRMMKDSDHKGFRKMPDTRPFPKDAKFGDRGAKRKSPDMELMPDRRPAEFGDRGAKRKSIDMELMPNRRPAEEGYTFKRGGAARGDGIAKRGKTKGRFI